MASRALALDLAGVTRAAERQSRSENELLINGSLEMKNFIIAVAALLMSGVAFAQVGTTVKESGKATAETVKQGSENVKSGVTSQPDKTVHKAKAKVHK